MIDQRGPLIIVVLALAGCARVGVEQRISQLEVEEQRRQAKLDELNVQIDSAEHRMAEARADAEYQDCRATRALLESEIAIEKAECMRTVAERSACISKNDVRTAKGAGAGCIAGWLFAIATGGAAAPAVALGCASGAVLSESTRRECGDAPPACSSIDDYAPAVLLRHGVAAIPECRRTVVATLKARPTARVAGGQPSAAGTCPPWRIEWVEFQAPRVKRSGETWDTDGSGPDLAYTIDVDGRSSYRSPKYEAYQWNHSPQTELEVSPGQVVTIELVDRDLVSNDRIASFQVEIPAEAVSAPIAVESGRSTARVQVSCSATR